MVVVEVQATDRERLFFAPKLATYQLVICTCAGLERQPAVRPELTFAAEAEWGLHTGEQQGCANKSQIGNTGEYSRSLVLAAFRVAPVGAVLATHPAAQTGSGHDIADLPEEAGRAIAPGDDASTAFCLHWK